MLTRVVVAAHDAHLDLEGDVAAGSPTLGGLGKSLGGEDDRADMAEDVAPHVGNLFRYLLRIVGGAESLYFRLEPLSARRIERLRRVVAKGSGLQTPLEVLVVLDGLAPSRH